MGRNRFAKQTYTPAQIQTIFQRLSLPQHLVDKFSSPDFKPDLESLRQLQVYTVAAVPFESLALHYSLDHKINISPSSLFNKIVEKNAGRGGYCMENSTFFGTVLRSLGYKCWSTGARVSDENTDASKKEGYEGPKYMGWCHMVNIVTISSQRYLVDTGFGSSGPHHPVPLLPGDGIEEPNVGQQRISLSQEFIEDSVDPDQMLWVYRYRHSISSPWITGYCFSEVEFLQVDFEVMNLKTSTTPGLFTENVICVKMLMEDGDADGKVKLVGDMTLFNDEVTRRVDGKSEVIAKLGSEAERLEVLREWFGVDLSDEEFEGIHGMSTELAEESVLIQ